MMSSIFFSLRPKVLGSTGSYGRSTEVFSSRIRPIKPLTLAGSQQLRKLSYANSRDVLHSVAGVGSRRSSTRTEDECRYREYGVMPGRQVSVKRRDGVVKHDTAKHQIADGSARMTVIMTIPTEALTQGNDLIGPPGLKPAAKTAHAHEG